VAHGILGSARLVCQVANKRKVGVCSVAVSLGLATPIDGAHRQQLSAKRQESNASTGSALYQTCHVVPRPGAVAVAAAGQQQQYHQQKAPAAVHKMQVYEEFFMKLRGVH
jgi:hypothetical protein